jgi:phenylpyruvate tautomerase PptA (4-oxalocrotonate tautomerase family)
MPTYVCTVREGQLLPDQKSRIAAEVTRIHSEVTGAPTFFAQVIFEEVKPANHFMGGPPPVSDTGGRFGFTFDLAGCFRNSILIYSRAAFSVWNSPRCKHNLNLFILFSFHKKTRP